MKYGAALTALALALCALRCAGEKTAFFWGTWRCTGRTLTPFRGKLTSCAGKALFRVTLKRHAVRKHERLVYGVLILHDTLSARRFVLLRIVGKLSTRTRRAALTSWPGKLRKIGPFDAVRTDREVVKYMHAMQTNATMRHDVGIACDTRMAVASKVGAAGDAVVKLTSPECATSLQIDVSSSRAARKRRRAGFWYTAVITLAYIAQFVFIVREIKAMNTRGKTLSISLSGIALFFAYLLALTVFHSRRSLIGALVMFACACACAVWVLQLMDARRNPERPNSVLESAAIVVGLLLLFIAFYFVVRIFAQASFYLAALVYFCFFIPQIIKSHKDDDWDTLQLEYLIVTAVATVLFPFHIFLAPGNFLGMRTRPVLAVLIALYVWGQAGYLVWKNCEVTRPRDYTAIAGDDQ